MAFDFGARPHFADFAKVIDHRLEYRRRMFGQVAVDRPQRRLDILPRLLAVEQVDVDRLEKRGVQLHRLGNHLEQWT